MCSATIADLPNNKNKNRYLLFFDNGYAAYTQKEKIFPIIDSLTIPIERLSFDHIYFIRDYFDKYPKRTTVQLNQNDSVQLYFNKNWFDCKVLDMDCLLVKLELDKKMFYNLNKQIKWHDIWFYRGSFRLLPFYEQLQTRLEDAKLDDTLKLSQFELYADEKISKLEFNDICLIKFSSTYLPINSPILSKSQHQGELIDLNLEYLKINGHNQFKPHECNPNCVSRFEIKIRRSFNPLLIPIKCGWQRIVYEQSKTVRYGTKKLIQYKTPCNRFIRSLEEIDSYMTLTQSMLAIDMFSFDTTVKINREFKSNVKYFKQNDISKSIEKTAISCVNCIDTTKPQNFEYISTRIELNEVNPKLVCCDCTDNCSDKIKCACWQRTIQFASLATNEIDLNIGYKGRRLNQMLSTGIFECNTKCRCNQRCSNKVVQNGLIVRLELFKTMNKGWGVRCLDDLPKGAYLTTYSGELITEEDANLRALQTSDEYFTELDYIGCLKEVKSDKTSILTPSNSETDSDASNRKRKVCQTDIIVLDSDDEHEPLDNTGLISLNEQDYFQNSKVYVIDAKHYGNISRFFNHSCAPNTFIQNVFVNTNDLRFPQVAIFTLCSIKAGTELTWNYNYKIGSIKGRQLYCYCNMAKCRGRLI